MSTYAGTVYLETPLSFQNYQCGRFCCYNIHCFSYIATKNSRVAYREMASVARHVIVAPNRLCERHSCGQVTRIIHQGHIKSYDVTHQV